MKRSSLSEKNNICFEIELVLISFYKVQPTNFSSFNFEFNVKITSDIIITKKIEMFEDLLCPCLKNIALTDYIAYQN